MPEPASDRTSVAVVDPERFAYSITEVAHGFDVTRQHLHNLIRAGKIRTITLGRSVRIPADEVERLKTDGIR